MLPDTNDPPRPPRRRRRRRIHFSLLKRLAVELFFWLAAHAPQWALEGAVRGVMGVLRRAYRLPGNPLRSSIEALVVLARREGIEHDPRAVYQRLFDQCLAIGLGYVDVFHNGPEQAIRNTSFDPEDVERIRDLLKRHDGLMLTVSHNVGAVYGAMGLSRTFPTVIVARNQKGERNGAFTRDFFARMQVEARLVRDMGTIELARLCVRALRGGKVLVATLDLLHRKKNRTVVRMWGEELGLAPWAFRLAADLNAPLVPAYITVDDGRVGAVVGEPCVDPSPEALAQHYASFLEAQILRDPASWIFMADKRWRALLLRAAARAG